jgi:regulator of nonsense transcripts 2
MSLAISAPNRASLSAMGPEQREKEDTVRVARQRPILRVCSELALVGVIQDSPSRSGGEWVMRALKELVNSFFFAAYNDSPCFCTAVERPNLVILAPSYNFSQVIFPPLSWNNTPTPFQADFVGFGLTKST